MYCKQARLGLYIRYGHAKLENVDPTGTTCCDYQKFECNKRPRGMRLGLDCFDQSKFGGQGSKKRRKGH